MSKIRDFFKNIFGDYSSLNREYSSLRTLNSYTPRFLNYSDRAYDNLLYRACVERIASQTAKLTPTVKYAGGMSDYYSNLTYLLTNKPNEYENRYDFFYKIVAMLMCCSNAFVYVRVKDNRIVGLYPVNFSDIELLDVEGEIYVKFRFKNRGFTVYLPYSELIHLRRYYNEDDLFGSSQVDTLRPVFEVLKAIDAGMINAVEATSQLRGVIKYAGNMKKADLDKYKDEFVESYMGINGNGIAIMDSKCEFTPTKVEPKTISSGQHQQILNYISMHFGVSEAILKGCASEEDYNSFYELCIEPLLVQLSLEFTNKVFTEQEVKNGSEILLTANRLLFANTATKTTLVKEMTPLGMFSINEAREIFGYNPIENGDKHIMSLNYVDLDKANQYQIGESAKDGKE